MIAVTVLFVVIAIIYFANRHWSQYWKRLGVPYDEPYFIVGNVGQTFLGKKSVGELVTDVYRKYEGYPFVGFFRATSPILVVRDPEFIKAVTVKDFNCFMDNDIYVNKDVDKIFGRNPFVLKGEEWKVVRGQLTPCFTSGKMKAIFPLLEAVANRMIQYLDKELPKNNVLEMKELCSKFTIDNVASCAFGLEGKCFDEKNSSFRQLAHNFLSPGGLAAIKMAILFSFPWFYKFVNLRVVSQEVEDQLLGTVSNTLKYRKEHNVVRNDFLDLVSQLKETCTAFKFTDLDVTAHVASFFSDGYETSSLVMSSILFCLADNPQAQKTLREEIEESLQKNGDKITYESLMDMKYLDAVINESLRMFPVLPLLLKSCTKEYTYHSQPREDFREMSVTLKPGDSIVLPLLAFCHDPKYFEEPEKFIPERFLDENKVNSYKYVYFPFGEGQRSCLGRRFGLLQIKLGVARLIKDFELTVSSKTKLPLKFDPFYPMIIPKGGFWLNMNKINK